MKLTDAQRRVLEALSPTEWRTGRDVARSMAEITRRFLEVWAPDGIRLEVYVPPAPTRTLGVLARRGLATYEVRMGVTGWRRTPAGTAALEGGDGR